MPIKMKNIIIMFMITIMVGCKTSEKTTDLSNSIINNLSTNDYIKISDTRYSNQFVNKEEIAFFSGELSKYFDQSAIINDSKHASISGIVLEDKSDIKTILKDGRINVEVVFDRSGNAIAVSFRLPKDFNSNDLNMIAIENKIKKRITVDVKNMDASRKYILYNYPITSKSIR